MRALCHFGNAVGFSQTLGIFRSRGNNTVHGNSGDRGPAGIGPTVAPNDYLAIRLHRSESRDSARRRPFTLRLRRQPVALSRSTMVLAETRCNGWNRSFAGNNTVDSNPSETQGTITTFRPM